MILVALVAGGLGLILSWAVRRDTPRAHRLRQTEGVVDERMLLLSVPGMSFFLLGAGVMGLVMPGVGGALGVIAGGALVLLSGAAMVFGLYLTLLGITTMTIPRWLLPRDQR